MQRLDAAEELSTCAAPRSKVAESNFSQVERSAHAMLRPGWAGAYRGLETALKHLTSIIRSDDAQAMTEYALILAVILVIVVGGIRLISQSPFFR